MDLDNILLKYDVLIGYRFLSDEINYLNLEQFKLYKDNIIFIPSNNKNNPFVLANKLTKLNKNKKVCLIIPGQMFNIFGNRKGRGEGWYDKFLSTIPKDWCRIGIIKESKVSFSKIDIKSWDELVDYIISVGEFLKIYETMARK